MCFYRDEGPYGSQTRPYFRMNDAVLGEVEPFGAFYRDVAPGRYHVAVDSYVGDLGAARAVDLVPGQEVYFKIVSSNNWIAGGGQSGDSGYSRPTFYSISANNADASPAGC